MAKTLFIVDDEVFRALPDAVQKKLLAETKNLFSFIPQFTVEARRPELFPATLHFTDSVVKLVDKSEDVTGTLDDMRRQEDSNVRVSIKEKGVHLNLKQLSFSPVGPPDRGGVGGQWKTTVVEGGGQRVSLTMTFGVAALEAAGQAVVDEELKGRTLEDILNDRRKAIAKQGLGYFGKHAALTSVREEMESRLISGHTPLKDWPKGQVENVATACARLIAHEARHQYILPHSARGLGAEEANIWGDKNFEQFDGTDKANILAAIHRFDTDWNSARIHLDTCPRGQPSPFA